MKKKGLVFSLAALAALTGAYLGTRDLESDMEDAAEDTATPASLSQTVSDEEMAEVTIRKDAEEMVFQKSGDSWVYPENAGFPVDEQQIDSIFAKLADVIPERVLEEPGELEEYGLDNPALSITLKKTDETSFTYLFGDTNSSTGDAYLQVEGEDAIYTVDGDIPESMQFSLYDVAEMEELPTVDSGSITKLSVQKNGEDFVTFQKDEETGIVWKMILEDGTESAVDSTQLNSLTATATGLSYASMADYPDDDLAKYGLEEPAAEIVLNYEEEVEIESEEVEPETLELDDGEPEVTEDIEEAELEMTELDVESPELEEDLEESDLEMDGEDLEPVEDTEEATVETEFGMDDADEEDADTEETVTVEYVPKTLLVKVGSTDEDGNYYVQGNDCTGIYTMDADSIEMFLNLDEMDYVDKTVHTISLSNLQKLEVTYQGKTSELFYAEEDVLPESDAEEQEDTTEEEPVEEIMEEAAEGSEEDETSAAESRVSGEETAEAFVGDAEGEETEEITEEATRESETVTNYYVDDNIVDGNTFQSFINKLSALSAQTKGNISEGDFDAEEPVIVIKVTKNDGTSAEYKYYSDDSGLYTVIPDSGFASKVNKMSVTDILEAYEALLQSS
ncbi:MAG: DUF4340 domain-containing protein [Blautia sp.]|nr:DUF4340 domain-containing protein [Blautia sp.]